MSGACSVLALNALKNSTRNSSTDKLRELVGKNAASHPSGHATLLVTRMINRCRSRMLVCTVAASPSPGRARLRLHTTISVNEPGIVTEVDLGRSRGTPRSTYSTRPLPSRREFNYSMYAGFPFSVLLAQCSFRVGRGISSPLRKERFFQRRARMARRFELCRHLMSHIIDN